MNYVALTFDVDWAPDDAIDEVADLLLRHGARATWFATHASPALERLRGNADAFEIGIHPNFQEGSTHGRTPSEVLRYCTDIIPDARSMRTHGLLQSGALLNEVLERTNIVTDVSLFLPGVEGIQPFLYPIRPTRLVRIPFYWEDDVELQMPGPDWEGDRLFRAKGLKVLNFHPIHVALNSSTPVAYQRLKNASQPLSEIRLSDYRRMVTEEGGARTLLERLLKSRQLGDQWRLIRELDLEWRRKLK
jgi:hypothetical protein